MESFSDLRAGFGAPGARFSPIPFWFLNGDMDREELERQLRLMAGVGIGGVVLHARHGHTVPYLSEEWLAGIRHCVEVCATLGMTAWLYDEDNFPSGYAGGATLAAYPGGQAKHLCLVAEPREDDTIDQRPRCGDVRCLGQRQEVGIAVPRRALRHEEVDAAGGRVAPTAR